MVRANRQAEIRITLAGVDLSDKIAPRLRSFNLTERRSDAADQLEVSISDHDGRMEIPPKGAVIDLRVGWSGEPLADKGQFKVDEVDHSGAPDVLTLRARSADLTGALRIRQRKSWTDTTLGSVLEDLAGRNALTTRIAPSLAGKPIAVLEQAGESDIALVRRLGRRYDAVATIKAGHLIFSPIGAGSNATGQGLPTVTITRSDGDGHRYTEAGRDTYAGVSATWHDVTGAARHRVRAGGKTGSIDTDQDGDGDTGKVKHLRRTYASQAEAQAAADAEWGRLKRGKKTMSYTLAVGRPDLFPEVAIKFQGFKPQIDAESWIIEQVATRLDGDGGLVTTLELEIAGQEEDAGDA